MNATDEEKEEDMTLSQEILVLDFGDDKQAEFLKSELSSTEFGRGKYDLFMIMNKQYINCCYHSR